jgi:DNA polymerase III alpha subunit (gram-positive type)
MHTKNQRNISVDVESDGPLHGTHSMISFGAVIVENGLQRTFYATLKPISEIWIPEALAISGFTREQTMKFPDPRDAMQNFEKWIQDNVDGRPILWSDNPSFDAGYINWYFLTFLGRNPFGWSASGIGQLYKGIANDTHATFKHLRKTKHTHNPVDDAKGNAEALLKMLEYMETQSKVKLS